MEVSDNDLTPELISKRKKTKKINYRALRSYIETEFPFHKVHVVYGAGGCLEQAENPVEKPAIPPSHATQKPEQRYRHTEYEAFSVFLALNAINLVLSAIQLL